MLDKKILDLDSDVDRHQSVTYWPFCHARRFQRIPSKSIHNLLRYTEECQFTNGRES